MVGEVLSEDIAVTDINLGESSCIVADVMRQNCPRMEV